ncbi:hypothetical protein ACLESO_02135 [Pyxidicoccus sp. 3LG]
MGGPNSVNGGSGNSGAGAAEAARRAEEARQRAEAARRAAEAARQKELERAKPRTNDVVSSFDGTSRKAQQDKLLGGTVPQQAQAPRAGSGEKPPASLDAVDARDAQAARKVPDGQTFTDPSSGTKYQVRQNASTGETVLSDAASGSTVTIKPDGSYTATATVKEPTKSGGTRDTTWTKSSDAQGRPTSLQSQQRQAEQHPETGATTTTTSTQYNLSKAPPVPQSRTEQVQMERPPAALAKQQGMPQGPVSVKTETQFSAQGLPAKQVKTTEARTPGFNANDVNAFESGSNGAFQNASKGEDHHKTNNAPTNLKPGESSLTMTEETLFNAKGEPAVSKQKTDSVSVQKHPGDTNGNGVQVVRSQHQVNRGPADAASADGLPALSTTPSGTLDSSTTVTGYDPDGSRFDKGHASRTQTVSQSSGTIDANGQPQVTHKPMEVKSLQEGSDNRWTYDHVSLQVGADGKPVKGQEPKKLDKERQLPWHQDVKDFALSGLQDLADLAGDVASDALSFAKDVVLKPVDAVIDQATAPLKKELTDEVKKLNSPGDTLTLNGSLDVKVGLKGGIEGEAEIERTADGKYQLSAEVTADFGVGLVGSASVSAGGRMEFKFDSPEEAAKAAIILGKGPASLASGGEDQKFMMDHLSAMEVTVGAGAEAGLGGKFGPGGAELSASIEANTGYRVEFDKGKPTHLVRTTEVEGSGAAGVATDLKGKAGLNIGGDVTGSVSLETKIPLDASKLDGKDVLAFLASPASAPFAGPAETSITVEGSIDTGTSGHFFSAEVSGLSGEEVQSITKKLMDGKYETAFDDVKVDAKMTTGSFKDRELGLGAKLGVVDFNVSGRHRDVTAEGGNGNGGTTVSLGKGNRGGSDGTSGSSNPTGSTSTGGTDKPSQQSQSPTKQPGTPPPPTNYRVNPATGALVPVPTTETKPATQAKPPATTDTGSTTTTGGRPVPVVTNPELPGRTTHVRYDKGGVRIEAGPQATPEDIQAHLETARVLQKYEGVTGKVRQLIDKVKQALTGMPGYGSQGFESRLEVQKLNNILQGLEATQKQLDASAAGVAGRSTPVTPAERERLQKEIAQVGAQLRVHEAQVDSLAKGRGYVAREDTAALNAGKELKALELLQKAQGPNMWRNLISQHLGDENKATRELLHQYRATVVADAINEAVTKHEGAAPNPPCTPEALTDGGWTSPSGIVFSASGSKNAASDLDVSVSGPDSASLAPLMFDFNQHIEDRTGLPPETLLDVNLLDGTEIPRGQSWGAIKDDINKYEKQFAQAEVLLSDDAKGSLRRELEAAGLKLDPKAVEMAEEAKKVLKEGVEALKTQYPNLSPEELKALAGSNIYQGFMQNVDTLTARRDALLEQFKAEGHPYDPKTGSLANLTPEQARELNALNVEIHKDHMKARLYAFDAYTTPSTFIDIVRNGQGQENVPLSADQYKVSAQENAWNAVKHLGEKGTSPEVIDSAKYVDRTLKALQQATAGSDPATADRIQRILDNEGAGLKKLLALRKDGLHSKDSLSEEEQAAATQATRELEAQLKGVLDSLDIQPRSGSTRDLMMALWVHAAK